MAVSRFEHSVFGGDGSLYCVSKEKYALDEAGAIAAAELDADAVAQLDGEWRARYGFYLDEDGARRNGWYLERDSLQGCEVWAFEIKARKAMDGSSQPSHGARS